MADNTTLPATGLGTADIIVATDKIGGVDYQRVKLALGDDGTASDAPSGGGTESGVLRVTVASDSTGVLSVDDNGGNLSVDDGGGSLTVDGTVAVSGTVTVDASGHAVPITDNSGSITVDGTFWQATQPVSGTVTATVGTVTAVTSITNVVHVDDNSSTLSVDDGAGSLTVDNAGTFAVQDSQVVADNAGFTDGTTKVQPVGYIFDEVAGTALTENDAAAARIDSKRAQISVIEDATTRGQRATVTAANALKVDASGVAVPITDNSGSLTVDYATTGSGNATGALRVELANNGTGVLATVGAVTAITNALPAGTNAIGKLSANGGVTIGDVNVISSIPGTGATNLGKAEDAAHTSGDTGIMSLGVRKDTATALAGSDGDYQPYITDASGRLHVNVGTSALPTGAALDATITTTNTEIGATNESAPASDTGTSGLNGRLQRIAQRLSSAITLLNGGLPAALASNGGLKVELASALASGTDSVAAVQSGTWTVQPGNTANTTAWKVDGSAVTQPISLTASTTFMDIDVDETEDDIKTSAGTIFGWVITNVAASTRYVRFYNATAANTTVGTTAAQLCLAIPAGAGVSWHSDHGLSFSTAFCIAATTGVAANDTGAPGTNDIIAFVEYA